MQNRDAGQSVVSGGRLAAAGTLASAALVASHCLGPIVFLVFGTTIGALSVLSALEHYRAYFIATGFAFWGYGFYWLYVARGHEHPGRARTVLWVSLGVLLFAIALPKLALYLAG